MLIKNNIQEIDQRSVDVKIKVMLTLKKLIPLETFKEEKNKEKVLKYLEKLGFLILASNLGLITNKRRSIETESFTRFQLEYMGKYFPIGKWVISSL